MLWTGVGRTAAGRSFVPVPLAVLRAGNRWLRTDDPERERMPETRRVLDALRLTPGLRVADVGAGGGFFSFRIASLVGTAGHVVATDTDDEAIDVLEREVSARDAAQVEPRLVRETATGLERGAYDRVLLVNVYPFLECREPAGRAYLRDLVGALRMGGEMVLFHDGVNGPRPGDPRPCWQPDGATVAEWLPDGAEVVSLETVVAGVDETRRPGYLLRVRRTGSREGVAALQ